MTEEWDKYRLAQVRGWLKGIETATGKVRAIRSTIAQEKENCDMLKGIDYASDGQRAVLLHGDDSIARHVIKINDMVDELQSLSVPYTEAVTSATEVFVKLESHPKACEIMTSHYIDGLSWDEVARKINYGCDYIKELSRTATIECYGHMPAHEREPRLPAL